LRLEKDLNIANTTGPSFNITDKSDGRRSVGYFTSYSEASLDNDVFFSSSNYKTTYQVFITFYTSSSTPNIYQAFINNNTTASTTINTLDNGSYTYPTAVTSALKFSFRYTNYANTNKIISLGYNIQSFLSLQYNDGGNWITVDPSYYTLNSTPLAMSGTSALFDFNVIFSEELKGGNYRFMYKYHANDISRVINFTKEKSSSSAIERLAHYSQTSYVPAGTTFNTNLNFDYKGLNLDAIVASSSVNPNLPAYVDNYSHSVSFLTTFNISKFSTIESVTLKDTLYNAGYKTYVVEYKIRAENGSSTPYTHNIVERPVTIQNIYKDNVGANLNNLEATREASETIFGINFQIDSTLATQIYKLQPGSPNQYFELSVTAKHLDLTVMDQNDIVGLSYSATNRLNIHMSDETAPGIYTFSVRYFRDGQWITISPNIVIKKNNGVNAYLKDIRFSQTAQDTNYPEIYVSDANGTVIPSPYLPSVYFAGIDYNEADAYGVTHFRIFGSVANIPLSSYMPSIIDYLPEGATVARKTLTYENLGFSYTPEVGKNTTNQTQIELLRTDFTLLDDGTEPSEGAQAIITYRVTSENGNVVYYHLTVVDVVYNFTMLFEVYYATINASNLLELTKFNNETIIFDITNFHALDAFGNPIPIDTSASSGLPPFNSIASIESDVYMFYSAVGENLYRYRFGRNKSGFYDFKVVLPQNKFDYDIFFNGTPLEDNAKLDGKYFYIQYATTNRTRVFQIVIYDNEVPSDLWGLYDYTQIWDKMN
jgi:hypothetical protein